MWSIEIKTSRPLVRAPDQGLEVLRVNKNTEPRHRNFVAQSILTSNEKKVQQNSRLFVTSNYGAIVINGNYNSFLVL